MIYNLYSIRDLKTSFGVPYARINDSDAIRDFQRKCMSEDEVGRAFVADYQLFRVGYFDDSTGHLTDAEPEYLTAGNEVLQNA